jgi:hypothetical protein
MRFCHTPRSTIVRMIDIENLTTLSPDSDRVRWAPLVPTKTEAIYLTRGKLRRALVMIAMRNGPITPREALKHLSKLKPRGFATCDQRWQETQIIRTRTDQTR